MAGAWYGNTYIGDSTNEAVNGTSANERFFGEAGDDQLFGEDGNDEVHGGVGSDLLEGGKGNDTLTDVDGLPFGFSGIIGRDTLRGGEGDDLLTIRSCDTGDVANGGAGFDTLQVVFNAFGATSALPPNTPITFTLGPGGAASLVQINSINTLSVLNIERVAIYTADGNDVLVGGAGDDTLYGGDGNDRLVGGDGNDRIDGGRGVQDLDGGNGFDLVSFDVSNVATQQNIRNAAVISLGAAGTVRNFEAFDYIYTGSGADLFNITQTSAVDIYSGAGADRINVGDGGSYIFGGLDADIITTGAGYDEVDGGDGANSVRLGAGNDQYYHETSRAYLGNESVWGEAGHDEIYTAAGNDRNYGGDGDDYIYNGQGADSAEGGAGNDTLYGENGADTLDGGAGDDVLDAEDDPYTELVLAASDVLFGGIGDDRLAGGIGSDRMVGGTGNDLLTLLLGIDGGTDLQVDTLEGGTGQDTLETWIGQFAGTQDVTVILGATTRVRIGNTVVANAVGMEALVVSAPILGNSRLVGGGLDDRLFGGNGNDQLTGLGGNDQLGGGTGTDTVLGGAGNDTVSSQYLGGNDLVDAGAGDDNVTINTPWLSQTLQPGVSTIEGGTGNDRLTIYGGDRSLSISGADLLVDGVVVARITGFESIGIFSSGTTNDSLVGTTGADSINGGAGNDTLQGLAGADSLDGSVGNDLLAGGNDSDTLTDTSGANTLQGGDGNDTLTIAMDGLADTVQGGTGADLLIVNGFATSAVTMTGNLGTGATLSLNGVLQASISGTELLALSTSGSFDDVLIGGAGADTISSSFGGDTVSTGAGDDVVVFSVDATGTDVVDLGLGTDRVSISYFAGTDPFVFDLTQGGGAVIRVGGVNRGTVSGAEQLTISTGGGNDTITGGSLGDTISGGQGANRLNGGDGDDLLSVWIDALADTVAGGLGSDTLNVSGAESPVIARAVGANGYEVLLGGTTVVSATGIERVAVSGSNDSLAGDQISGTSGDDSLYGNAGDDRLTDTAGGNEQIYGGLGADTIDGGGGADTLAGGTGNDRVTGGGGADVFVFFNTAEGVDRVTDMQAVDTIRISVIGFGGGLTVGGDVVLVSGAAPVASTSGGTFLYNTGTGVLSWDVDGSGAAVAVAFAELRQFGSAATLTAAQFEVF